jgi:hypothetical protein
MEIRGNFNQLGEVHCNILSFLINYCNQFSIVIETNMSFLDPDYYHEIKGSGKTVGAIESAGRFSAA